jgi:hypothetical protein
MTRPLLAILVFFCSSVVAARLIDFLIGNKGNKWVKDHLLFRPWYNLQLVHPLQFVYTSADWFSRLANALFGTKLISYRAYLFSTLVGQSAGLGFYIVLDQLGFSRTISNDPGWPGKIAWFSIFGGINPFFDFVSFAITRYLIRRIADSKKLAFALSFWLLDLAFCVIIGVLSFSVANVVMRLIAPTDGLSLWFGRYSAYDQGFMAAFTGFIPTLLHLIFFGCALLLGIAEASRKSVCLLLERFEEGKDHPLVVLATIVAALIALLGALLTLSRPK